MYSIHRYSDIKFPIIFVYDWLKHYIAEIKWYGFGILIIQVIVIMRKINCTSREYFHIMLVNIS